MSSFKKATLHCLTTVGNACQ